MINTDEVLSRVGRDDARGMTIGEKVYFDGSKRDSVNVMVYTYFHKRTNLRFTISETEDKSVCALERLEDFNPAA